MGIISAIFIGLIVGAIVKFLMARKSPDGWIVTILIGLAGSFIGTYLGQALGLYRAGEPAGFIGSIVGAMIFFYSIGSSSNEARKPLALSNTISSAALLLNESKGNFAHS